REEATRVHHPLFEPQRGGLVEVHEVGRDAAREHLELVFPLADEIELVLAPEQADRGEAVQLARCEQERAAMGHVADPFRAESAAQGGALARALEGAAS